MTNIETVIVNKELLNYTFTQNTFFARKIAKQLVMLACITCYIVLSGAWLSSEATKQKLVDPLFTGPKGAAYYKPTVNPPVSLSDAYSYAQKWAELLSSLHFNRLEEQMRARKPLFYRDVFERDYLSPLINKGVFNAVSENNLIITSAELQTDLISKILQDDGLIVYLFTVRLLQTTQGLTEKDETTESTFYISLVEVDRATAIEGLQIYKTQVARG